MFMMLLASCAMLQPPAARVSQPNEIADNPAILHNGTVPRDQLTLQGVRLGEPRSAILSSRITKEADAGWIVCKDGSRYRIDNDIIATLGVWNYDVLDRLNIKSRDQIEPLFGKHDSIEDAGQLYLYRFAGGHVSVLWHKYEERVIAVNVSK